jgi:antirestriction protein ArdC/phage/plasmid primase-like uncharacterized protein
MPDQQKKPFHQQVADKLIEQIEAGAAPWQKPWVPGKSIMPVNPTTGKQYRGVNSLMLMLQDQDDNRWLTFNQAQKAGYKVKKGEHGTPVQYWVFYEKVNKIDPVTGQPELDKKGNPVKVEAELEKPKVIISYVFNASQIDGIPPQERSAGFAWDPHQRAEDILRHSGVPIIHDQRDRAYYSPQKDDIHLTPRDRFPSAEKFYDAALHEYAHATGHESRLNRETLVKNGEVEYAREELVAQIASLMICAEVGIQPDMNRNASYIGHWVKDLKNHPMEICKAAQQADRVLNYVMELERERNKDRDPEQEEKRQATPEFSPKFSVEYALAGQKALRESLDNPENAYTFQHEGKELFAAKGTETLYSAPGHMPTAGEQFEVQTRVNAFDIDGRMYDVTMRESLIRQEDGGNEVAAPKTPIEIRDTGHTLTFPLDWTGELAVKPCAEDRDGHVRSGYTVPENEVQFYGVYAAREDATELHVKDFDTREAAQGYADLVKDEYQRQTGKETEVAEPVRENRQYIDVPYPDRREARVKGAEWDGEAKSWYVPPGVEAGLLTVKWPTHDPAATRAAQETKQAERDRSGNQDKIYINVPKAEKDAAKEFGARWDREAVSWYVPKNVNPEPLTAKWPIHDPAQAARVQSAIQSTEATRQREQIQYLTVPYKEKDTAKSAGARWDGEKSRWYAAPGADLDKLKRWFPENQPSQGPILSPREEFAAKLQSVGAIVSGDHPIFDKKSHRIEAEGDKNGERSCFYVAHPDGRAAGYIKNNRTQEEVYWAAKGYLLSDADRKALHDKAIETLAKREAEMEKTFTKTADRLQKQLRNLEPVTTPTPYLTAKGIQVHPGVFAAGQTTCIPIHNITGEVRSMSYIQPDGAKRYAKNSQKEGGFHAVGGMRALEKASASVISEGYATAATVAQALGHATVAAFDAGNLSAVAQALHRAMPDKPIIIAGDNDTHLEAAGKPNVGHEKALAAAEAVNGKAVFPRFADGEWEQNSKSFTDFNDLAQKSAFGIEAVKSQIGSVVERQVEKLKQEQERTKGQEKNRGGKEISRV